MNLHIMWSRHFSSCCFFARIHSDLVCAGVSLLKSKVLVSHSYLTFPDVSFTVFFFFLSRPCSLRDLSSLTKDWTWAPTVKAPSPNHWIIREFQASVTLKVRHCRDSPSQDRLPRLGLPVWRQHRLSPQEELPQFWYLSTCGLPHLGCGL